MNLKLTIQSEDYGFIVEAIKLRTLSLLESLDMQKEAQEKVDPIGPCSFAPPPVKQEGKPVEKPVEEFRFEWKEVEKKKPHWTQTAKGKKIMAARKRKGTK